MESDLELDGLEDEVVNSALVRDAIRLEAANVAARKKQALAEATADAEIAECASALEKLMADRRASPAEMDKYLQRAIRAQAAKGRR